MKILCVFFFVSLSLIMNAKEWYKTTKYNCSDPYKLRTVLSQNKWMTKKIPIKYEQVNKGYVYVEISNGTIFEKKYPINESILVESLTLDNKKSTKLKAHINDIISKDKIPLFVQMAPSFAGYFISNHSATALSGIFTYLFNEQGSSSLNKQTISTLIAPEGTIDHVITISLKSNRVYFISNYYYSVNVGSNKMKMLLSSCIYPCNIYHVGFKTQIGVNDKKIIKKNQVWEVYDLEGGAKHPGHLEETHQDNSYIYFKAKNDFSAFYEVYRIHKSGGAFQAKSDTNWETLYNKTVPL